MESSAFEAGHASGQTVLILGLFLLMIAAGIFFIIATIKAFTRKTPGWIIGSVVSAIVAFVSLIGGFSMAMYAINKQAGKRIEAMMGTKREVSPDGRVSLEIPGNWVQQPGKAGIAIFFATDPRDTHCVMVTVDSRQDFVGSLEEYEQAATDGLAANLSGTVATSSPESGKAGGFPAIRRQIHGTSANIRLAYRVAAVETPENYYRILTWTTPTREKSAEGLFGEIIDSFRLETEEKGAAAGDVTARVNAILADLLGTGVEELTPGTRIIEDLGADSLDAVEIVMAVEEEFGLSIPDEEAEKLRTPGDIVRYVEARVNASGTAEPVR